MKILIIGSKGFIGSNAFQYFGHHDVFGCDITLNLDNSSRYFYVDANNPDYDTLFSEHFFDICINASGSANVAFSMEHPFLDFQSNVKNVFQLLNSFLKHNPNCKIINLSSAAVYGNPQKLPVVETDYKMPMSPYGFHKQMTELLMTEFSTIYQLRCCSVRIFSAYGPGLKKQLFWDIYQKSKNSDTITLFGTGKETRDFIFVEDVMKALEMIIENADFKGEIYNLGCGEETTINQAAQQFIDVINPSLKLEFNNQVKEGDPTRWCADIDRLKALDTKIVFKTTIQEGLSRYYEWLKTHKL